MGVGGDPRAGTEPPLSATGRRAQGWMGAGGGRTGLARRRHASTPSTPRSRKSPERRFRPPRPVEVDEDPPRWGCPGVSLPMRGVETESRERLSVVRSVVRESRLARDQATLRTGTRSGRSPGEAGDPGSRQGLRLVPCCCTASQDSGMDRQELAQRRGSRRVCTRQPLDHLPHGVSRPPPPPRPAGGRGVAFPPHDRAPRRS